MNRLLAADGRALTISVEHGLYGVPSWSAGLTALDTVVTTAVEAGVDAMTLTTGQADLLQRVRGPHKPALIIRGDLWDAYAERRPEPLYCRPLARGVERAVALDAACVVASLMVLPGHPELLPACTATIDVLRADCTAAGMPLMVEVLALAPSPDVPGVDSSPETIAMMVRQAVELGADIVKCDPPDPLGEFARVVEAAGNRPLLAGGGMPASDDELILRSSELMKLGASGLAYGRNIWRATDPVEMILSLRHLVHSS
jgi:DhnA family fructose-bisphosphate aldolase class Ia